MNRLLDTTTDQRVSTLVQLSPNDIEGIVTTAVKDAFENAYPKEKAYKTLKQVAELFMVSLPTVHAWVNAGKLNAYRVGGRTLFDEAELEQTVSSKRVLKYKHGGRR